MIYSTSETLIRANQDSGVSDAYIIFINSSLVEMIND